MDRTRLVVGSSHLNELMGRLTTLPITTLHHPAVAPSAPRRRVIVVASSVVPRVDGLDADVVVFMFVAFVFVFQAIWRRPCLGGGPRSGLSSLWTMR